MRARLAIPLAVGTLALGVAAQAVATGPPDQLTPDEGVQFTSGDPVTFSASVLTVPFPDQMDFYITDEQPQLGLNGVISNSINVLHGPSNGADPAVYTASPSPNADWPKKPGTYYWQAVYVDCNQPPADCFIESLTTPSFTINPLPAAAVVSATQVETFLDRHPRHRTRKRKVKFAFSSNVAGASFRCLFAKGWADCKSPHVFRRLEPGRYKFKARAVVNGLEDPTPVSWTFRILRRDTD